MCNQGEADSKKSPEEKFYLDNAEVEILWVNPVIYFCPSIRVTFD